MKKLTSILFSSLLIIILLPFSLFGEENTVYIRNINDWNALAKNCILDSYSNNLKVVLDNDLKFDDAFVSIPFFNGEFDGNGHTLSGVNLSSDQDENGIFRITGKDAYIKNVKADYRYDGENIKIGFIGYNQGKVENIIVKANISGQDYVGAVVGYNAVNGSISGCESSGAIYGKHYVGGIVGINYGLVKNCNNHAYINTIVEDELLDISSISIATLTKSENVASITDVGGIVGSNFSYIKNCNNYTTIGYSHVGYNVGGVAGSSSGYIASSNNFGKIYGRKDVGGLVGQVEPSMELEFKEDYLQKTSREIDNIKASVDRAIDLSKDIGDNTYDGLSTMSSDLRNAQDAIDNMLKSGYEWDEDEHKFVRSDEYEGYRSALSASLTNVFNKMEEIANSNSDNNNALSDELSNTNSNLNALGQDLINFGDSITNDKVTYKDTSIDDLEGDTIGKLYKCNNYEVVEGDINVGGIAGSMAKENDLDPEDDFTIVGQTSFDATYTIRAVVDGCNNTARITSKRNNVGGIVGSQDLGVIKNCINQGIVDASDCDYVGGIVGLSVAYVNDNYAKCFIYGKNYVGGIAGSGLKLNDNGSLAQIIEANSNVGMILGNYSKIDSELVTDSDNLDDNWYLYDDYGAIDNISYQNIAYKIDEDKMLDMDIDESLKKVNIYFIDDKTCVLKQVMDYGSSMSLDKVPFISDNDKDHGVWDDLDESKLNNVTRDLLFNSQYDDIYPAISSFEEPLAYVVAQGEFLSGDTISANKEEDDNSVTYKYRINVSGNSKVSYLRIYTNGYSNYEIYEVVDGNKNKVDYEVDGNYAKIAYNENVNQIIVNKTVNSSTYVYIGVAILVVGVGLVVIKKKKKKKATVNN